MPFFVETMVLKWTRVGVSLMITLTVDTLEGVRVWFILFGFKLRRVGLEISLAAPHEVAVMFGFI